MIRSIRKNFWIAFLPLCCVALIFGGHLADAQAAPKTGTLTVRITGIRNAERNIRVAVRTRESIVVAAKIVEIDPKTLSAQAVFENLPEGTYGVAVIHDENKNGKLDFNETGMPVEGYGHSNNPAQRPGPPSFDETKFNFTAPAATIEITLIYWP